ncbi:malonate--CoA ligase [Acidimangrovimonas pyrenivorans]|uniref:Malonyl-CoA synthase n=1 Tax=Acidimangrovimonas pyrenivorans TaxID=2030798 RepID=A0ABV7AJ47_9RHOB
MANTLYDALFAPLAGRDKAFLILPDGREISGDAFLRMVARFAHALRGAGVEPGDRVAVQIAKSPEGLAVYAAAVAAGAIFLPLNVGYTADEIDYFLGNATPKVFLCDGTKAAALAPVAARHGAALMTLSGDGSGTFTDAAEGQPETIDPAPRGPEDLAAFLYTSGTTGRSKGAMLSHRNLLSNAQVLADYWRFTEEDVLLHALPIFHTHGLFVASNVSLLTGGAMIFLPAFSVDEVLRLMPQATAMMGVPTFYTRLLDDPRFTREVAKGMRLFTSGSAPLLAETHVAFEQRTGHRILERYGMTETNMNTSNPYDGERRAGTVGFPLPGVELKITDPETGAPLPQGEPGMIEVRGENVFQGYWQMPEKTAEELRADGFFITGDIGVMDADGYVSIVGRQKDLIITGGYNVYPKEVELVLDEQPGVLESAVIGVPHPDFGEAVFGVLVAAKGETPDEGAIQAALGGKLAKFKQPKGLAVVEALPRNTMGKVQKNILREMFADRFKG